MKGWMYIVECADGSYYTGSTNHLELRIEQHNAGEGANHTKKRLPVKLVYFEEYLRIDEAYYREKQVQGWGRKKKEALIKGAFNDLHRLAECTNSTHYKNFTNEKNKRAHHFTIHSKGAFGYAQAPSTTRWFSEAWWLSELRWLSEAETTIEESTETLNQFWN